MSGGHGGQPVEQEGVVTVRVQVDGQAVGGSEVQDRLGVADRVRVEVGRAADHTRPRFHGVTEYGEAVRTRGAGEEPGHGDRGQLGEPPQGPAGRQDAFEGAEAPHIADAHMRAQRGGTVAELEQSGLGGTVPDVLGPVRRRTSRRTGERGVGVGVGLGGGGQQEVAAQVQTGSPGGETARRPNGLDARAADPHVDGAPVVEPRPAEEERGRVAGAFGHRAAPGGETRSHTVRRA